MTAPALPEDVVDQIASILKREYGWELDPRVKVDARVLAEIRAAIAAHVAPGGEPVAVPTVTWDEKHGALCVRFVPPGTHAMRTYIAHNNPFVAVDYGAGGTIHSVEVLAPATRPAPPVSASFEESLTGLDYEVTHHPDRMVTTYAIVGLDAVRAAHRAEVERAVAEGKGPDAARVAKLEAALRDATPFVVTSGVGTFTHPRAKANRDAVLWAIHDLLPGTIRAEGIETPRAALEDPK